MTQIALRGTNELVQLPLRRKGPMVEPMGDSVSAKCEPPRALRALAQIIENDLCHRCGSCVGICPTHVLGVDDNEFPVVKNLSACTDCDLCVKVCPGDEFNALETAKEMFGYVPDIEDTHGSFVSGYLSYATDPHVRDRSTSGGFVSALLMSLIEQGEIDGALVIRADDTVLYKGVPTIARTPEEVFAATKSKYAIVPTNVAFREIRETPGRYAMVGLPCQIQGYHKAAKLDKRIRERIVLTIGLLCHAAIEHDPLKILFNNLGDEKKDVEKFIYRVGKHPGASFAFMKDGRKVPVLFPKSKKYQPSAIEMMNILYRLYTPNRCMTCYDAMVELADIAVGDPWMPTPAEDVDFYQGYSFLVTRSERGEKYLHKSYRGGALQLLKLSEAATRGCQVMMSTEKRHRAFRLLRSRKRQGLPVPNYHFEIPDHTTFKEKVKTEINLWTHVFCSLPSLRDYVLRFWLSKVGFCILRANYFRREFRTWRRDRKMLRMVREGKLQGIVKMPDPELKW